MNKKSTKGDTPATQHDLAMLDKRLSAKIDSLQEDMTEAKAVLCIVVEDVQGLKQDVSVLKNDVSGLKQDVSVLKNDVSGLKQDVSVLKNDVSELKTGMVDVKKALGTILEVVQATDLPSKNAEMHGPMLENHEKRITATEVQIRMIRR